MMIKKFGLSKLVELCQNKFLTERYGETILVPPHFGPDPNDIRYGWITKIGDKLLKLVEESKKRGGNYYWAFVHNYEDDHYSLCWNCKIKKLWHFRLRYIFGERLKSFNPWRDWNLNNKCAICPTKSMLIAIINDDTLIFDKSKECIPTLCLIGEENDYLKIKEIGYEGLIKEIKNKFLSEIKLINFPRKVLENESEIISQDKKIKRIPKVEYI